MRRRPASATQQILQCVVIAALIPLFPLTSASAGGPPCPGNPGSTNRKAWVADFPDSVTCTAGVPVSEAVSCVKNTGMAAQPTNFLQATWPSFLVRIGDSVGGCSFVCNTGACFVGNDGLPVELLTFGVD